MTVPVPDQLEYISDANGVTKDFSYPKRFIQKDEIAVFLRDDKGIETPQSLNIDYTIAGSSWPTGGTVSFINAPKLPNKVVRYRKTQAKQTVGLENNQRNDAPSVELQLDRLTMSLQDASSLAERALSFPAGSNGHLIQPVPLPEPGKGLVGNESGTGYKNSKYDLDELQDLSIANLNATQSARNRSVLAEERSLEARDRSETARTGSEAARDVSVANASLSLIYKTQAELAAMAAGAPLFTVVPPLASAPSPYLLQVDAGTQVWTHDGTTRTLVGWLGKIVFPLVRNLLEFDKTLGPVGTEIEAEGYRYKIAAAASADINVFTSGGVPLFVMPPNGSHYPWAAWGPISDGVTDNYSKLRNAGDACRKNNISGLTFPSGQYFIGQEFVIDWQASIVGAKGEVYNNGKGGTNFFFPAGTNGFRLARAATSPSGNLGDDSYFKGFLLRCIGDNNDSQGHGIVMDARGFWEDVRVENFPEDNWHIEATASTGGRNANLFTLLRCSGHGSGRDNFFISGADANAGNLIACNGVNAGRINFHERSFLGNTHIGSHSSSPGRRSYGRGSDGQGYRCKLDHVATADTVPVTGANWQAYWELWQPSTTYNAIAVGTKYYNGRGDRTDANFPIYHYISTNANAANTFLGCYAEGAGGVATGGSYFINSNTAVIGGLIGAIDKPNSSAVRPGSMPFSTVTYADNNNPSTLNRISFSTGMDVRYGAYQMTAYKEGLGQISWGMVYIPDSNYWYFGASQASSRTYFLMEKDNVFNLPAGLMDFSPQGVGINGRVHKGVSSLPTSGTVRRGDIFYRLSPSANGKIGWVVTTAGEMGSTAVVKEFGAIDA